MRNPVKTVIYSHTPLKLRPTLRRIRACPHSWSVFFVLVWPFPWRYSLPHPFLSVEEIEKHPDTRNEYQSGIQQLYNIPIYRARNTPLRSLYRLFEDLSACDFVMKNNVSRTKALTVQSDSRSSTKGQVLWNSNCCQTNLIILYYSIRAEIQWLETALWITLWKQ